jgi:hypothetical protein
MKKILFPIALLGWLASFAIHIVSLTGTDLQTDYPMIMLLHAGVFVVWIPTVLFLKKDHDYRQFHQSGIWSRSNPVNFLKIVSKNAPWALKIVAAAGFVYAILNFLLCMTTSFPHEPNAARMFSGHWLAFYGIALAALYPSQRQTVL